MYGDRFLYYHSLNVLLVLIGSNQAFSSCQHLICHHRPHLGPKTISAVQSCRAYFPTPLQTFRSPPKRSSRHCRCTTREVGTKAVRARSRGCLRRSEDWNCVSACHEDQNQRHLYLSHCFEVLIRSNASTDNQRAKTNLRTDMLSP